MKILLKKQKKCIFHNMQVNQKFISSYMNNKKSFGFNKNHIIFYIIDFFNRKVKSQLNLEPLSI